MKLQQPKFLVVISCHVLFLLAQSAFAAEFFEFVNPSTGSAHFNAISDNGVIAGYFSYDPEDVSEPIRWTRDGGIQYLGFLDPEQPRLQSEARGITANGSTILGWQRRNLAEFGYYFLWSEEEGYTDLSIDHEVVSHISADGSVLVGEQTQPDGGSHAMLWGPNGPTDIGVLLGKNVSYVRGISADASVAVGRSRLDGVVDGSSTSDFYWTNGSGIQPLQPLPGAEHTAVRVLSADGKVAIGTADSADGDRSPIAWLSDWEGRFDDAPFVLPIAEGTVGIPYHVSSDGVVIFGRVTIEGSDCPCSSVVWIDQQQMMTFEDWLIQEHQLGESIAGWDFDEFPVLVGWNGGFGGISNNDRFLVGNAINPNGVRSYFLIDFGAPVPEPSAVVMLVLGSLCCAGIRRRR
jgi:uncharacterized membrane protein